MGEAKRRRDTGDYPEQQTRFEGITSWADRLTLRVAGKLGAEPIYDPESKQILVRPPDADRVKKLSQSDDPINDAILIAETFHGWGDGFIKIGEVDLFESEELIDKLISIFCGLMTEGGWAGIDGSSQSESGLDTLGGVGHFYKEGLWLPCSERVALLGQVDVRNDGLPEYGACPLYIDKTKRMFVSARLLPERPQRWHAVSGAAPIGYYQVSILFPHNDIKPSNTIRKSMNNGRLRGPMCEVLNGVCAVMADGRIVPCVRNGLNRKRAAWYAFLARIASIAIGIVADFRHQWNIETEEDVIGSFTKTPLRLGSTPEQVKSLFYARDLPMTESGRKRPILHWVRAHKRRLAAGVDIDIRKFLRGVEVFEMGGFGFRITSPTKAAPG